jgi:hypothetical protein
MEVHAHTRTGTPSISPLFRIKKNYIHRSASWVGDDHYALDHTRDFFHFDDRQEIRLI